MCYPGDVVMYRINQQRIFLIIYGYLFNIMYHNIDKDKKSRFWFQILLYLYKASVQNIHRFTSTKAYTFF